MNIGQITSGVSAEIKYQAQHVQNTSQKTEVEVESAITQNIGRTVYENFVPRGKGDDELLNKSLDQANKALDKVDRYIEREVHEKTGSVMYKLKDRKTGEVIAEFPPKKIQDMIAKMWELAGLFVDEKA